MRRLTTILLFIALAINAKSQQKDLASKVNVFLGTSGDHGQLSPAASYPFSMLDIGPQTYPNTHTGYEHKAKVFLGFTHGRMEGVGCMGSGGNLLIKPFTGNDPAICELLKKTESGSPGYYRVSFKDGIHTEFTLKERSAMERYHFPKSNHGFYIDLAHALTNGFKNEQHRVNGNTISGWIESGTTCRMGIYRIYYALHFDQPVTFKDSTVHTFTVLTNSADLTIRVAFSSFCEADTKAAVNKQSFEAVKKQSQAAWNKELNRIQVSGDPKEEKLFYSLLYRTLHAPFQISTRAYNGWSIWDNYRTEFPLLSIMQPERYPDMIHSIARLYQTGKKNWATKNEPSNTVRTEHAIVVLLDAYRKGYPIDFKAIRDSLLKETDNLDFKTPDKALESSYDTWAMAQILSILKEDSLSKVYLNKAANWKNYWDRDFKDLSKKDIDDLEARKMYQGTIWQYRWFVPFDNKGLIEACGGEQEYLKQLDEFFAKDYYNAGNEPDIQAPYMYNFTSQPWKSQNVIHQYAKDRVVQYYQDDNYRGIGPQIGRVYNNRPDGLLQTMDEDLGEMSSWYVMAAIGLSPACVGYPIYYLSVPLFRDVHIAKLHIQVVGKGRYIQSAEFNLLPLHRNWISQQEIMQGGTLIIYAGDRPNKQFGIQDQFITHIKNNL